MNDLEAAARLLSASPDFRVLRRFVLRDAELADARVRSLCVIDFETTGVEEADRAIEIGMVRVEYDWERGTLGRVLDRYGGLEDPGCELPPHIVALTGLTDEKLRGQRFDDKRVMEIAAKSSLIVAHNAEFDRGFGERRFPFLKEAVWACSMKDVPWGAYGIASTKLEFIAYKLGFFHDAHRAVADCEITAGILGCPLVDGSTGLLHLLQAARCARWRVWAINAPFATKDLLKARGYAWRDIPGTTDKAWRVETVDPNAECSFLRSEVFRRGGPVLIEEVGAKNRFSDRRAALESVQL